MILVGPAGERLIGIGELVGVHGVRGQARFHPFNPDSSVLDSVREVFLVAKNETPRAGRLQDARPHGRVWLLTIEGVDSIDAANALRGTTIAVRESELPELEPGEFYWYQLLGLDVVDTEGRSIGSVSEILATPGSDVLVVIRDGKESMIPMVDGMIVEVDVGRRRIVVEPIAGLVD
jgi:16S rRNA processing protein RimM